MSETKPIPLEEARQNTKRLRLESFKDITLSTTAAYLVKDWIPREGLIVVWGPPKSGKSFLVFDAAMAVARGRVWRGKRVKSGPVVFVASEGASGTRKRKEAYRQRHLGPDEDAPPFYLVPDVVVMPKDRGDLIAAIRAELGDVLPVLIVLDTVNRTLDGSENDPQDMSQYVRACDKIRETFGCAVLVVHHCGIEATRPRGHTSLTGAADCQIAVKKGHDGTISATVEHMKDGPEGETIYSRLEAVTVGKDEDGDDITSCVVVEATETPGALAEGPKLTKNQQTMLSLLHDAMPNGLTVNEWNEAAREIGLGLKRKADFHDFRNALKAKGLVYSYGERWFVRQLAR